MTRFQEYIESDQGPEDLCKEIEQLNKKLADAYSIYDKEVTEMSDSYSERLKTLQKENVEEVERLRSMKDRYFVDAGRAEKGLSDLQKKYEKALETLNNRETFINWVNEHYPEIVKEYLGFENVSI